MKNDRETEDWIHWVNFIDQYSISCTEVDSELNRTKQIKDCHTVAVKQKQEASFNFTF